MRLIIPVILLLVPLEVGTAQQVARASLDSVLRALPVNSWIRVRTMQDEDARGVLLRVDDSALRISTSDTAREIPLAEVRELFLQSNAARKGAIAGAIAAGIGVGAWAGMMSAGMCEADCGNAGVEGFAVGGAIGGAIGAVSGFVIGSFVPTWTPYWNNLHGPFSRQVPSVRRDSGRWTPSLQLGASTASGPRTLLFAATMEKRVRQGIALGFELARADAGSHATTFSTAITAPDGTTQFRTSDVRTSHSSHHLGLISRWPLGVASARLDLGTLAGMSRRATASVIQESQQPAMARDDVRWDPVFGLGLATRFRMLNGELRWISPIASHESSSLMTASLRLTLGR